MSNSAFVLVLLACAGCPRGGGGDDCIENNECPGTEVCGRDKSCTDPSNVREVTVTWTVNGAPANTVSCSGRDFTLAFLGDGFDDELAFAPVPCVTGQFFVDRLPRRFRSVQLGDGGVVVPIRSDGTATGDLRF